MRGPGTTSLGNFMAGVTYAALVTCMLCGPILDKVHSNMEDKVGAFNLSKFCVFLFLY